MSVELFIYPQFYDAAWQPTAINTTEYIPDGDVWSTAFVQNSSNGAAGMVTQAIQTYPPTAANTWYAVASNAFSPFGLGAVPFINGSGLAASGVFGGWGFLSNNGQAGAYTKITGLTVGVSYDITLTLAAPMSGNGILNLLLFDSAGTIFGNILVPPTDLMQINVPAQTFLNNSGTDIIFGFTFSDGSSPQELIKIDSWSMMENTSNGYTVEDLLSNGQVILDLYNFEDIPLTLSVDNFTNAAEKVQSYSKAFKIPGTKRNNRILKNEYDITSSLVGTINSYDFNPLRKTQIYLQQDGFIIFEGFMKLISVDVKDTELSYNINLYSEVIALKDELKNKKFMDLDFSELLHNYVKSVIKSSWYSAGLLLNNPLPINSNAGALGSMNTTVIKYPFIDWDHQMKIADGTGDPSANVGFPEGDNLGSAFRPVIQLRYLIKQIFSATNFEYSSAFIDSADFGKLYMDFNWGNANTPELADLGNFQSYWFDVISGTNPPTNNTTGFNQWTTLKQVQGTHGSFTSTAPTDYDFATGIFTSTIQNQQVTVNYEFNVRNTNPFFGNTGMCEIQWITNEQLGVNAVQNDLQNQFINYNSSRTFSGSVTVWLDIGDTFQPMFRQTWVFNSGVILRQGGRFPLNANQILNTPSCAGIIWVMQSSPLVSNSLLTTLRGKLGQWDFISGLLKMFNLVTIVNPVNPNEIIIETYDSLFNVIGGGGLDLKTRGVNKDWTEKVDAQEWKYKALFPKKFTKFQYAVDKADYVFKVYQDMFQGFLYGSYEIDASGFNILQGEQLISAKPFAATLIKAYDSAFPWMITPAVYSVNDKGESSAFDNLPRIMYDNGQNVIGPAQTFFFPSMNGEFGENFQILYQMSNFSDLPPTATSNDLNYGTCQILSMNNPTTENLFNRFWKTYYSQLYNADTRALTLKINLTPADINQFNFSDLVMIKNRAYRVNKIDYKPNELAKVELILIT